MFGYVRARREELTVRQDTLYRAAYCGLCKEMGRCTGQCSRLTLSYDMVFLYCIRMALRGSVPAVKKGRCLLHPWRARQIVQSDAELVYAARVSALLAYGKLRDDLCDERGWKRLVKRFAQPFLAHAQRRAGLAELYARIEEHLQALSDLEAKELPSVDAPAEIFGALLADIFAFGFTGDAEKIARELGFRTGRFIYVADAADDMREDAKKGSYNPFLLLYGQTPDAEQRKAIEMAMRLDLSALGAAADLMEEHPLSPIIRNIIGIGMPDTFCKTQEH